MNRSGTIRILLTIFYAIFYNVDILTYEQFFITIIIENEGQSRMLSEHKPSEPKLYRDLDPAPPK
jgi:hypothetical protein